MKPVVASVVIDRPPEDVFAYLDTLRKRPEFTDHYLVDWSFSGPQRGVGAKARTRVHTSASNRDWVDVEVVETKAPERIVEHATGARGKRLTVTTYALQPAEGGGTAGRARDLGREGAAHRARDAPGPAAVAAQGQQPGAAAAETSRGSDPVRNLEGVRPR